MIEELEKTVTKEMEDKWYHTFGQQAMYMRNGTYKIAGLYSNDTRELFLMFIHQQEFQTEFE